MNNSSNSNYGLVSIIMPNYNSANYIVNTVNSVLLQTYSNWELIIVDDCSTDNSLEIINQFNDARIKVYKTDVNSGAATARNIAIEKAQGDWIAFLDSDDIWISDKLEKQLKFMVENDYSFTYTSYLVVDSSLQEINRFEPKKDSCSYKDILKHNSIGCLTVIYNAKKIGKFYMPVEAVKREDLACWLSILKNGETGYCLREDLAKYVIHEKSVSSNKLKMIKYQWNVYRKVEKLNWFKSVYYLVCWAINGVLKYR